MSHLRVAEERLNVALEAFLSGFNVYHQRFFEYGYSSKKSTIGTVFTKFCPFT